MTRKTLRARTAADLIDAVFKAEGWVHTPGNPKVARASALYTLTVDHKTKRFIATPKDAAQ